MIRSSSLKASISAFLLLGASAPRADWPMLRKTPDHAPILSGEIRPPFRLAWVRHFDGERLGTAMEPILGGGKLFVATHNGSVCALNAFTGEPVWRFVANGPFLQSPSYSAGRVLCGSANGFLYALDAKTGAMKWSRNLGSGGFAASPIPSDGAIYLGSRDGSFYAVKIASGEIFWKRELGAPVRQSAACDRGKVYVVSEDMRAHRLDGSTGKSDWVSPQLSGQSARDEYPVLMKSGNRTLVAIRSNPALSFPFQLAQDRNLLCRLAGADSGDWKKLDDWLNSDAAKGSPSLWENEREGILRYLDANPDARTFFLLDAATGRPAANPPVLWIGGCQGVGAPPVPLPGGKWLVYGRAAYGNWNLGVAPLVGLGSYDPSTNRIAPFFHNQGRRPLWNSFWGTADESQSFTVVGSLVLIAHQDTLSGFNAKTNDLFPIWGERDTYGGFKNLPWALNEWHGPARGGVAVEGNRIYWQTGSRILCVVSGERDDPAKDQSAAFAAAVIRRAPSSPSMSAEILRRRIIYETDTLLSRRWAPLLVEPGIAGREFFFDNSGDLFEALARAYPHVSKSLQSRILARLREEWRSHPPYEKNAAYSLEEGARRERYAVPKSQYERLDPNLPYSPFGNFYSIWLYAIRCGEWKPVRDAWPRMKVVFEDFVKSGWDLNPMKGDRYANRYFASTIAMESMAAKFGDAVACQEAERMRAKTSEELKGWWKESAKATRLSTLNGASDLDQFIGSGRGVFYGISPHKAKLALFEDLEPETAREIMKTSPDDVSIVWSVFSALCPTWWLAGEEAQVHYGENYLDPPDFSDSAYRVLAWLKGARYDELSEKCDEPFCQADLSWIVKSSIALDAAKATKVDTKMNGSNRREKSGIDQTKSER